MSAAVYGFNNVGSGNNVIDRRIRFSGGRFATKNGAERGDRPCLQGTVGDSLLLAPAAASSPEAGVATASTIIAIATPRIRDDIARAAEGLIDVAVARGDFDSALSALEDDDRRIDYAIVDLAALRALVRRSRRMKPGPIWRSPAAILVLPSSELQDALGLLQACLGVLFWEDDFEKLRGLLILTLEGYSGVRPELLPDFTTDRVRAGLIGRLTPIERRTLELLGAALSNRAIAQELDVAESIAKSLVRTVLTKLRLKNRTEAAVLAARWSGPDSAGPALETKLTATQIAS